MIIKKIMSTKVETVTPDTLLNEVAKKMQQNDCGCIVVTKDDRLVGMITDRDLAIRCVAESHDVTSTAAEDVMTKEILYCMETDSADSVTKNMSNNKVRRLPVLNAEKRLVGIISLGDLASHSNHELCGQALGDICRKSDSDES